MTATTRGFAVRPAGACPNTPDAGAHAWVPGEFVDLLTFGTPDLGVAVFFGRCDCCGVALLSLDTYGGYPTAGSPCFELPDATLREG
ncbi:MAG: hypothetical protein HY241_04910 [Actinobacteria bacterium]|nr:hypothetical protein [Actinomycetota bacterium]